MNSADNLLFNLRDYALKSLLSVQLPTSAPFQLCVLMLLLFLLHWSQVDALYLSRVVMMAQAFTLSTGRQSEMVIYKFKTVWNT